MVFIRSLDQIPAAAFSELCTFLCKTGNTVTPTDAIVRALHLWMAAQVKGVTPGVTYGYVAPAKEAGRQPTVCVAH